MTVRLLLSVLLIPATCLNAQQPDLGDVTEEHVMIPMRDGKRLSSYVYRPSGTGPWPVVFEQRYASLRGRTTREAAAKLAAEIEATGGPAHLCGHSMGGMVVLELAATRPELCRSLILCNTTPAFGGKDDTFKREFVSARLAPLENGKTMAEMAPASVRGMSGDETAQADLDFMADLMAQTPEAAYRAAIECLVTFDRRAALEGLIMPVLLIGGENDPASPAKTMQRMAEKIPDAECHILPGGHMTPVEQAAGTNRALAAFLARVEAA